MPIDEKEAHDKLVREAHLLPVFKYHLSDPSLYGSYRCPPDLVIYDIERKRLPMGDLAKLCGVSPSTIPNWRSNWGSVSYAHYVKLLSIRNGIRVLDRSIVNVVLPNILDGVIKKLGPFPIVPHHEDKRYLNELMTGYKRYSTYYYGEVWREILAYIKEVEAEDPIGLLTRHEHLVWDCPLFEASSGCELYIDRLVRSWIDDERLDDEVTGKEWRETRLAYELSIDDDWGESDHPDAGGPRLS